MLGTTVGRLRVVGILEGTSYLTLLGIAMPLKYIAGKPEMVEVVGMAHGLLFITYCLLLAHAWTSKLLTMKWAAAGVVASVLPFGPFAFDRKLVEIVTDK
jgi:integral membrane protein